MREYELPEHLRRERCGHLGRGGVQEVDVTTRMCLSHLFPKDHSTVKTEGEIWSDF